MANKPKRESNDSLQYIRTDGRVVSCQISYSNISSNYDLRQCLISDIIIVVDKQQTHDVITFCEKHVGRKKHVTMEFDRSPQFGASYLIDMQHFLSWLLKLSRRTNLPIEVSWNLTSWVGGRGWGHRLENQFKVVYYQKRSALIYFNKLIFRPCNVTANY